MKCDNCKKHDDCASGSGLVWPCGAYAPKVVTNAERIRTISDEELAKILNAFTEYFSECNRSADEVDCKDCELNDLCQLHEGKAIEWLQKPAEGE